MVEVKLLKENPELHGLSMAFFEHDKIKNRYEQKSELAPCRSYLSDIIFDLKNKLPHVSTFSKNCTFDIKNDPTYIGLWFSDKHWEALGDKETFLKNLKHINEIEKQADVEPTIVFKTKHPELLIVKADKTWKDCCWKISIYSFLLKTYSYSSRKITNETYWNLFTKYKKIWLSNIKEDKEIFDKETFKSCWDKDAYYQYNTVHVLVGFISIANNLNPVMTKLLGIKK
jgi:hypothetical protein